jgi:hypothetical protein
MWTSSLMTLLFNTGLPTIEAGVQMHTESARDAMLAALLGQADIVVAPGPAIRRIESTARQTIWLVTDPGHLAHPSILCRALVGSGAGRHVQVAGFTAAAPESMRAWMDQFSDQDVAIRRARAPSRPA